MALFNDSRNKWEKLIKSDTGITVFHPKVEKTCVFRILPQIINGQPAPWRLGCGENEISDFLQAEYVVRNWGLNSVTCIDRCQGDQPGTPGVFYKIVAQLHTAVNSGDRPEFAKYLPARRGEQYQRPAGTGMYFKGLMYPSRLGFIQTLMYVGNDKMFRDGKYEVVLLSASAMGLLVGMINKQIEGAQTDDWRRLFKCANMVDINTGFKIECLRDTGSASEFASVSTDDKGGVKKFLLRPQDGTCPISLETAVKNWRNWDDLLYVMSRKEAWNTALTATNPDIVAYTGRDEIDNLPTICRDKAQYYLDVESGKIQVAPQVATQQFQSPTQMQQARQAPALPPAQTPQYGQPQYGQAPAQPQQPVQPQYVQPPAQQAQYGQPPAQPQPVQPNPYGQPAPVQQAQQQYGQAPAQSFQPPAQPAPVQPAQQQQYGQAPAQTFQPPVNQVASQDSMVNLQNALNQAKNGQDPF